MECAVETTIVISHQRQRQRPKNRIDGGNMRSNSDDLAPRLSITSCTCLVASLHSKNNNESRSVKCQTNRAEHLHKNYFIFFTKYIKSSTSKTPTPQQRHFYGFYAWATNSFALESQWKRRRCQR